MGADRPEGPGTDPDDQLFVTIPHGEAFLIQGIDESDPVAWCARKADADFIQTALNQFVMMSLMKDVYTVLAAARAQAKRSVR